MGINQASLPMFAAGTKLTPEQFNQLMAKEYTGGMDPAKFFQTNYGQAGPRTYDTALAHMRGYSDTSDNPAPYGAQSVRVADGSGPAGDGGYRVMYSMSPDGQVTIDSNDYTGGYAAQELDKAGTFNLGEFLTKAAIAGFSGYGAAPLFGAAGSVAAGAGGGAVGGGLNAVMNEQNILKGIAGGALAGGAGAYLKDLAGFGAGAPTGEWTPDSSDWLSDLPGQIEAQGLPAGFPELSDLASGASSTGLDALDTLGQIGSNMSFNGAPGAVSGEGIPFGTEVPAGLEGAGEAEWVTPINPALASAGPNASTLIDAGLGTDSGLVSMPNASTFGNTLPGAGVLGTGLLASGGFTGEGLAAGSVGSGLLSGTSVGVTALKDYTQLANAVLGIGGGVLGLVGANNAGDAAESAAASANPWATSGGLALADQQLQELMTNPSAVASRDPSFGLRIQGAQRATSKYGQGSGAMAVAGANASTDWYNQRLAQLGQLAGAPGNSAGAAQIGLQGQNQSYQQLMAALSQIGFGVNQAFGGSSQLPPSLLERILLRGGV